MFTPEIKKYGGRKFLPPLFFLKLLYTRVKMRVLNNVIFLQIFIESRLLGRLAGADEAKALCGA